MVEQSLIYRRLIGARIRSQLEYRTSFLLNATGAFLASCLDLVQILILFHHIPAMSGWSVEEVFFLFGVTSVAFAITDMVLGHLDGFPTLIREGTFDHLLLRPLGSLFQVISSDFALRRLGKLLQGGIVFVIAVMRLDIDWDPGRVLMVPVMLVSGAAIFAAIWVMGASLVFWTTETGEINNAFTYGGNFMTQYPINIYGTWVRRFLAFIVPMAFINYFPSLYILDKPDPLGMPRFLRFLSPVVASGLSLLAARVWGLAVRHYRSTGS